MCLSLALSPVGLRRILAKAKSTLRPQRKARTISRSMNISLGAIRLLKLKVSMAPFNTVIDLKEYIFIWQYERLHCTVYEDLVKTMP
jgi:hypothetical protein